MKQAIRPMPFVLSRLSHVLVDHLKEPCLDSEHKVKPILEKSSATDPVVGLLLHMLEEKKATGKMICCFLQDFVKDARIEVHKSIAPKPYGLDFYLIHTLHTFEVIKNEQEVAKVDKWITEFASKTGAPTRIGELYKPPDGIVALRFSMVSHCSLQSAGVAAILYFSEDKWYSRLVHTPVSLQRR